MDKYPCAFCFTLSISYTCTFCFVLTSICIIHMSVGVDIHIKQNTHEVLIGMSLSDWHFKSAFICNWTKSTRCYIKLSSKENNIIRGAGRWKEESCFIITQKNVHSLSLLSLLGVLRKFYLCLNQGKVLLGFLSETLSSWLTFWAQNTQSMGRKRHRPQAMWGLSWCLCAARGGPGTYELRHSASDCDSHLFS